MSTIERAEFEALRSQVATLAELGETVADFTDALKERGLVSGDRGYMPEDVAPAGVDTAGTRVRAGGALRTTAGEWLTRSLQEGSGSGAYAVPEEYADVFDRLAARAVGLASGFTVISTETDTLHVPKLTADATAAWTAEAATITASDPTLNEVIATPRKLAALTRMSNEWVDDARARPSGLGFVAQNLIRALALKLDLGIFEGSGSAPEIRGLKNVSGIGTVSMGTNGATPTNLDPFADAIGTLAQNNAEATAIVMHPRTWQTLSKLKEQTSGNNKPLLQESAGSGSQGLQRRIYGVPVYLSSQLSITETQGTSTDCSSAYVVQADQIVAVRRRDVSIELDRSRYFESDESVLRAILRIDVVVPNPTAI